MEATLSGAFDVTDAAPSTDRAQVTAIYNNNPVVNNISGSGTITNNNQIINHVYPRPRTPPTGHISDISVSATLPPKPIIFHGRNVNRGVAQLLKRGTARLAILGSGGMGKTTVALALLYDIRIVNRFSGKHQRLFLSCEALLDADDMVVSLAKILGLQASADLLNSVVTHLKETSRTLLVLDNLETVWLAGGSPVAAVDDLLGRLAQIPSLSLIITCRGTDFPKSVNWSNVKGAILKPLPFDAALQTFQDSAGSRLADTELLAAEQLVYAVDRLPLAVTLLGQLARRNTPTELLARWDREHSALLRTSRSGRTNNLEVSLEISMSMLHDADDTQEALPLLSICCMLPDGIRPPVFDALRPYFKNLDQARDTLCAYALANLGVDQILRLLNPIRHFVLTRHPAKPEHRDILHSVYFNIASRLPLEVDEHYQKLAAATAPEMRNLSYLLFTLVDRPSQQVVEAVVRLTMFTYNQEPTITLARSLLPHLEQHPRWRADCLRAIGHARSQLDDYESAADSLTVATQLYLELGESVLANWCRRNAADAHRMFGQYDVAERLLNDARTAEAESGNDIGLAACDKGLGILLLIRNNHRAAIQHVSAARQTFMSLGQLFNAACCSEDLGNIYISQGDLDLAVVEIEHARSVFSNFDDKYMVAQTTCSLAGVRRHQLSFDLAEQLLSEAMEYFKASRQAYEIACCGYELGHLRSAQGRRQEALEHFGIALGLFTRFGVPPVVGQYRQKMRFSDLFFYRNLVAGSLPPELSKLASKPSIWTIPETATQGPLGRARLRLLQLLLLPMKSIVLLSEYLIPLMEDRPDRLPSLRLKQLDKWISQLAQRSSLPSFWQTLIRRWFSVVFSAINYATLPELVQLRQAPRPQQQQRHCTLQLQVLWMQVQTRQRNLLQLVLLLLLLLLLSPLVVVVQQQQQPLMRLLAFLLELLFMSLLARHMLQLMYYLRLLLMTLVQVRPLSPMLLLLPLSLLPMLLLLSLLPPLLLLVLLLVPPLMQLLVLVLPPLVLPLLVPLPLPPLPLPLNLDQ